MTDSPTARLIAEAIDASGKTQREIANEIGFERPNVVSMLKSGEMRMHRTSTIKVFAQRLRNARNPQKVIIAAVV
ncbi:hypothetical protein [Thalassococcus profundi]|uniref:hypothetical protein n=1 Tax=Thalassococcus profundi TaxID=2282382 RepID=UPI0018F26334|nr:hypothetical protein [Thalassococcus profundi]